MTKSFTGTSVLSIILRGVELISAAVVTGLVGSYIHSVNNAHDSVESRMAYTMSIAAISLFVSIVLMIPFKFTFWAFGLDLALFICWMTAFGLQLNLISGGCNSTWYWSNWGYYWGGYYNTIPVGDINQSIVGNAWCSKWRAMVAYSFIGGWFWLMSAILGISYIIRSRGEEKKHPGNQHSHEEPITTADQEEKLAISP